MIDACCTIVLFVRPSLCRLRAGSRRPGPTEAVMPNYNKLPIYAIGRLLYVSSTVLANSEPNTEGQVLGMVFAAQQYFFHAMLKVMFESVLINLHIPLT